MSLLVGITSQRDVRWAGLKLSADGRLTWGSWGCLSHCLLHYMAHVGVIERPDPREWLDTLHRNRVIMRGSGMMPTRGLWATRFAPFATRVEAVYSGYTPAVGAKVKQYISRGIPVFAMVDHNPSVSGVQTHWVLIVEANGDSPASWLIADPWHGQIARLDTWYRAFLEFVFVDKITHKPHLLAVDLSQYQQITDYNFHGIHYAYIRATDGIYSDTAYKAHATALSIAKLPWSAYHFLRPAARWPLASQLAKLVAQIESAPRPTHRLVVDYETIDPAPTVSDLKEFIALYEAKYGQGTTAIYSRANILATVPREVIGDRPIIQAHYHHTRGPLPYGLEPALWQFSPTGRMLGTDGNVDWNYILDLEKMEIGAKEPPKHVDLLPYIRPIDQSNGKPYMMQMADGRQERYQYQPHPDDKSAWYITKNGQWEMWRVDSDGVVRLCADTSPDKADDGTSRYYIVSASDAELGGRMFPRLMVVGETYIELEPHAVQFFDKVTGAPHAQNSGYNRNRSVFVSQSADSMEVTIGDPSGELHTYRKGVGRVAWQSPWGRAKVSADDAGSYDNVREVVR